MTAMLSLRLLTIEASTVPTRHSTRQAELLSSRSFSSICAKLTGTSSSRSPLPFSGSYRTLACAVPEISRRPLCGERSDAVTLPQANTTRPTSGKVSGTMQSVVSVQMLVSASCGRQ